MPLFKKKAEMPTPEEIEAGKDKSYKDLIAPSVVSFRRSPGYYILGNTYRCVWAIRSYAETVEKIHRKLLCCASSVNLTV